MRRDGPPSGPRADLGLTSQLPYEPDILRAPLNKCVNRFLFEGAERESVRICFFAV